MLPTLGEERAPPIRRSCRSAPKTGRVLQVPIVEHEHEAGTIIYKDEDGSDVETPVTGGRCKLQWKPDWAMRWDALGVDYEMSGKDLIASVELPARSAASSAASRRRASTTSSSSTRRAQKISKSKGNGLRSRNG